MNGRNTSSITVLVSQQNQALPYAFCFKDIHQDMIHERKYISYRSVLSKYLTGRRVKKYIIVSIITAITMWACIYIVLKICGTTEIKLIKILQDNISALTILIVSLIFNGIVEIVRRIVRRFFS